MSLTGHKRRELDHEDSDTKDTSEVENPAKKRKLNSGQSDVNTSSTNDNSNASNDGGTLGKAVIVGSGLVGRSWAALFARGNYSVTLYDIDAKQLTAAMDDIKDKKLPLLAKFNLLNRETNDESTIASIVSNIGTSNNLEEALKDATFVQMAVPENLELKQKVLSQIDEALFKINNKNCIISSSCSTIVPSKLIKLMKHKENISNTLVSHPVNPPFAIPLVEIVPSPQTDVNVCNKVREIMIQIGMKPIVMKKECDGFVLNRLQYGLLQVAYQMYEENIANAEDIDLAVSYGLGTRWSFMGPFETIHLNAPNGVNDYCERYAKTCVGNIVKMQNNSLDWKPETWTKIHAEMSETIPVNTLKERCQWRDNRLMELARLKNEQNARDAAAAAKKQENNAANSQSESSGNQSKTKTKD